MANTLELLFDLRCCQSDDIISICTLSCICQLPHWECSVS